MSSAAAAAASGPPHTDCDAQQATTTAADSGMAFTVHAAAEGGARAGTLLTRHGVIRTPTALIYTRRGGSMYLTPDMLEKLKPEAQGVQINAMQFLDQPTPATLAKAGGGLARYIGLPRWPIVAVNRDPTLQEYGVGKPSNNSGAYAVIHSGGLLVTPARYMEAIRAARPDAFVSLADEVPGDAGRRRVAASVDRTARWLDECIERLREMDGEQQRQQQEQPAAGGAAAATADGAEAAAEQRRPQQEAPAAKRQRLEGGVAAAAAGAAAPANEEDGDGGDGSSDGATLLFAPVVGGAIPEERARSAKEAAARGRADGFALSGFGMGEDAALRRELLETAVAHLPAGKPRILLGMATPEEVLEGALAGADLFDCGYPTHCTANGYALAFPLRPPGGGAAGRGGAGGGAAFGAGSKAHAAAAGPAEGADDGKLNLWAPQYREDKRPLVEGCGCFACARHTRAYVHHLLHAHEMLGSVLLEAHNTHHWLGFFAALREAALEGRANEYAEWFAARRRAAREAARAS